jgi:autoinducer 2 (AI-2) kinase
VYDSIESASKDLVTWDKSILPSMDNYELYKEIRKKWKRAYELQLQLVDEGITTSMWKAPGL